MLLALMDRASAAALCDGGGGASKSSGGGCGGNDCGSHTAQQDSGRLEQHSTKQAAVALAALALI